MNKDYIKPYELQQRQRQTVESYWDMVGKPLTNKTQSDRQLDSELAKIEYLANKWKEEAEADMQDYDYKLLTRIQKRKI